MTKYAQKQASPFDRDRYHNKCCKWLLEKCMDIFKRMRTPEEAGNHAALQEVVLQVETNVWASIYRICDINRERKSCEA